MYTSKTILEELNSATADAPHEPDVLQLVKDLATTLKELFSAAGVEGAGDGFLKLPDGAEEVTPMDGEPDKDGKGGDENEDGARAAADVGGERGSEDEQRQADRMSGSA